MASEWVVMGQQVGEPGPEVLGEMFETEQAAVNLWERYEAAPAWEGRVWIETREVGPWTVSHGTTRNAEGDA